MDIESHVPWEHPWTLIGTFVGELEDYIALLSIDFFDLTRMMVFNARQSNSRHNKPKDI